MTGRRKTRGEAEIEALLKKLDPSTERYQCLAAARDFKASWVALGQRLTEVRESGQFKAWGYNNFEAYCRSELRLKGETANKLTRSFSFLRDHEPNVLELRPERELPALDVVDLLSRAREKVKLSDAQLATIHEEVFREPEPPSRAEVLKRFREFDPDAFKAPARPVVARTVGDGDVKKALLLAERLASLIEPMEVSGKSREGVIKLVGELREMFEATRQSVA